MSQTFANNISVKDYENLYSLCTIGATVPTGLEFIAKDEIEKKLNIEKTEVGQGKVYFDLPIESLSKIHTLRSVERLFLVIKTFDNYQYNESNEIALEHLKLLAKNISWSEVGKFWKENCKHQKILFKKRLNPNDTKLNQVTRELSSLKHNFSDNDDIRQKLIVENPDCTIRFRASANRIGKKQSITSQEAEYHFGGAIQDLTNWKVDLSNYNFEVLLTLGINFVSVSLSLTHESLHRRNIIDFGYTTLKASIAYNMLHLCKIETGDVVIDPMCGSGAIPIEAVQEWKESFHLAGDKSSIALKKCFINVRHINSVLSNSIIKAPVDILNWDITKLPLATNRVDVFVTDVPFGKRLGSKLDNHKLYPSMLAEMARVCKLKTGRACILTNDKKSIMNALTLLSNLWKLKKNFAVNVGGLRAAVYFLKRTDVFK